MFCVIDKIPVSGFNQEKVKVVFYRALYPFEARSHDEITIIPGDIVMVSQHLESGFTIFKYQNVY